jgi:DNA-binding response OmpR family regulator
MNAENLQITTMKSASPRESENSRTILFIDNGHRDRRRERSAILKNAGYKVHPARSFEQSLSRIGSGAYDLIIASTDGAPQQAQQFIEETRRNHPRQRLLVMKMSDADVAAEFESSSSEPKVLLERVDAILRPGDRSEPMAA